MTTFNQALSAKCRKALLAGLALVVLLTPICAMAAERDGTVLFFSLEDLKQALYNPTLSELSPSFSWRNPQQQANQESPIERNYRWGHGLGFDSYAYPGTRMPLWGY